MRLANWNADAYRDGFREDAHQLLAWGFQDVRSSIQPDTGETVVTGLIAEAIERRLGDPRTDERYFWLYDVTDDSVLHGEGRTGNSRRRADISIRSKAFRPAARYIFEAKRLSKPSNTITRYLGPEGMRRFISDTSYSRNATGAAMVGYVQTGTTDEWVEKLSNAFTGAGVDEHSLLVALKQLVSACGLTHWYVSVHRKHDATDVEICHVLLDCT
jgi:hypothetical protein